LDPDNRFSVDYLAAWFVQDGAMSTVRPPGELTTVFSSFEPGSGGEFPANALKVDLYVRKPVPGNDCRSIPDGAITATLGGIPGWQKRVAQTSEGDARSVALAAYSGGYCYSLTAYFGQENSDDAVFSQMVDSFVFVN
jgi:hypothetical protein